MLSEDRKHVRLEKMIRSSAQQAGTEIHHGHGMPWRNSHHQLNSSGGGGNLWGTSAPFLH